MVTRERPEQDRLARLRRNHEQNRATLRQAGIADDAAPIVCCRKCSLMESALFWTPRSHLDHTLHLWCPSCEHYGVRYHLDRGTVSYGRAPFRFRFRGKGPGLGLEALVVTVVLVGLASVAIPEVRERPIRAIGTALDRGAAGRSTWWGAGGEAGAADGGPITYVRRGDLRGDFDASRGEDGAAEVKYLAERNLTIVTVLPGSSRLHERLVEEGWTRL